ncbi:hypothetical protein G4B88_029733 [Cannabis sativa]|uniref:RNase H type-1 domain-containing protein n=1 Tax=Cannabis sativa TaxID=3483 RepID=A0A7J6GEV2_CANSA|nr:hypothetical protein G4B88_029733 [Cannabis sativa]
MCFKCGALSHEMKFCFKNPTVIKDDKGSFFPMYGTWMNEDAMERSPFQLPLPRWFSEWILNQQALKDPVIQNRLRNDRRWKEADSMECRELKRQLPGKRRQVEVLVEKRPETQELVLNRFPAVHLPGIGEITPFENTADLVVEKDIPVRPLQSIVTSPGVPSSPSAEDGTESTKHSDGKNTLTNQGRKLPGIGVQDLQFSSPTELISSPGDTRDKAVEERENFTLQRQFQIGQYINSLLGPQAQPLEWPSRVCWARAFEPLTGSITIDKFHREPTLFNPILQIEDFKCPEVERGPKKRKATDGFFMIPGVLPTEVAEEERSYSQSSGLNTQNLEETTKLATFSPGSNEGKLQKRKRGRPRKGNDTCSTPSTSAKRNKNSESIEMLGVNSTSLKKKNKKSALKGHGSHYRNLWNAKGIDLTIDLDNHFVIVEKSKEENTRCAIINVPERVICKVHEADKNVIFGTIESDPPGVIWNFLGIYGPPTLTGKELFWTRIGTIISNCNTPVVLFGDLNGTLADHECINYVNRKNSARYSFDLRRMVNRTGLIDLGCQGGRFTWFQKTSRTQGNSSVKRARLDRALASTDWRVLFPNAIVELLSVGTSDHKPIILNTIGGARCIRPQFKYELMWGRDPRCFWVVRNAWREELHSNPMINLYRKLKMTKNHLQKWNKAQFRNVLIWSERNRRVHNERDNDLTGIMRLVRLKIKDHMLVPNHRVPEVVSWAPPPPSWVTCNTDVAVSSNGSMLSAVFRNDRGKIISITTREVLFSDPLIAEANAVCLAAEVARDSGMQRVLFLSDNQCVANSFAASAHCIGDFRIHAAETRFKDFCSKFEEWEIVHISRLCNYMAHNIAKWALMHQKTGTIEIEDIHERVLDDFTDWDPGPPISLIRKVFILNVMKEMNFRMRNIVTPNSNSIIPNEFARDWSRGCKNLRELK